MEESQTNTPFDYNTEFMKIFILVFKIIFIIFVFLLLIVLMPKPNLNSRNKIFVEKGDTIKTVGKKLYASGIIWSPSLFDISSIILDKGKVIEGPYKFKSYDDILSIAYKIAVGNYGIPKVKITFPEGFTSKDMANRLTPDLPGFNQTTFLADAKPLEGYLFPDTYFFVPGTPENYIVQKLNLTFISENPKIVALNKNTEGQVVTIASIVQKEVQKPADMETVAEIFENRLNNNIPLESDATVGYALSKDPDSLAPADLKINSPYNTYLNVGLPPTAISNPGLDALNAAYDAVVLKKTTAYLYFLTGTDGNVHYAVTFAEHKANVAKYLN